MFRTTHTFTRFKQVKNSIHLDERFKTTKGNNEMSVNDNNPKPDYLLKVPYVKPDSSTGYREVGAVWKFKTEKAEGFSGHIHTETPPGPFLMFLNTPKPTPTKPTAKKKAVSKKKSKAKKKAATKRKS